MAIKRVLVPLDLSPLGEVKLPIAEEHARAFDAELVLLHILPAAAMERDGSVSEPEARARAYLDSVVAHMHALGVRARTVMATGPAAQTIVEQAREQHADIIIIGSNIRGGLPRLVLGGVADQVVRAAPCPVLLVKPRLEAGVAQAVRRFDEDAARSGPHAKRHLGIRPVEVSRIIGSVGRADDLGPDFRPPRSSRADENRFQKILDAMERGEGLPPVDLYKLGFGYYVLDGNHRVAAAKKLGQLEIDADVTEFVPLGDVEAQRVFAERRAFERATGLTRIEASMPGTPARLEQIIRAEVDAMGVADFREGARRWYVSTYRPLVRRIRKLGVAEHFPGERSADIVARIGDFRDQESERGGQPIGWDEAFDFFLQAHGFEESDSHRRLMILGRG